MLTTQHVHTFRQHEKLQQARDKALSSVFDAIVEMSVTGRVIKDLDSIFRKGADWDLGVDHILVLQVLLLAFAASFTRTLYLVTVSSSALLPFDCTGHLLQTH